MIMLLNIHNSVSTTHHNTHPYHRKLQYAVLNNLIKMMVYLTKCIRRAQSIKLTQSWFGICKTYCSFISIENILNAAQEYYDY